MREYKEQGRDTQRKQRRFMSSDPVNAVSVSGRPKVRQKKDRAQRDLSNSVLFSLIGQKLSEIQGLEEREAREGVQKDRGGRRTCRATRGHCKGSGNQIVIKEVDEKGQSGKRNLESNPRPLPTQIGL